MSATFPLIEDFKPSIRQIRDGKWEAKTWLPVIGEIATFADSWETAKLSLWFVAVAVYKFNLTSDSVGAPNQWSEQELRDALLAMKRIIGKESP